MRLVFRFDIDTHKCIRDGVPNLLDVSQEMNVPFTFFLNLGKSISVKESLSDKFHLVNKKTQSEKIEMMSARQKLGNRDYIFAASINPNILKYKSQIQSLCRSQCEVGIHGGKNHALWNKHARTWNREKTTKEIEWALLRIREIVPDYRPIGFASPGWSEPTDLLTILKESGFCYSADFRAKGQHECFLVDNNGIIPKIGVNLLGEPGGVAFFEYCRVKKWTNRQIIDFVISEIERNETCVLYDHPYYAGVKEIELIKCIINSAKGKKIDIVKLEDLI